LDAISKYSVDDIRQLIETGEPGKLPAEVVRHFELMEITRAMYSKYETRAVIINTLMMPVYGLSRAQANRLFVDTMNFFYTNNKIKAEAWRNIYADKLEDLAAYSLALDDVPAARRCLNDAARMRGVFDDKVHEIPQEMRQRPVVIYTINPEQLGMKRANSRELAKLIDQMPDLTDQERGRIKRDASVFDFTLFDQNDEADQD
jgi:hypothetical protein